MVMARNTKRFSRRTLALFWMLVVAIVIGTLIAYEQISALYVLATLALVTLLLIVGFADLEGVGRQDNENIAKTEI
jgi:Ca2+/Na+ antiporter